MTMHKTDILILGAGKSSNHLIGHLRSKAIQNQWRLTVADRDAEAVRKKVEVGEIMNVVALDIEDEQARKKLIGSHDLVISLLPAFLHDTIAEDCCALHKHFFTASYASPFLRELSDEVYKKDLTFVVELGLDPGLDHMSAMADIQRIRQSGGRIESFQSHTGGLIAPESVNNPWDYKFTWNPYNVVRAGAAGGLFLEDGCQKLIPYHKLFASAYHVDFPGMKDLEGYPNRDSLRYISFYGLQEASTVLRGTLRKSGFCAAWQQLIDLGLTSDQVSLHCDGMKTSEYFAVGSSRDQLMEKDFSPDVWRKLSWLGAESDEKLGLKGHHTPAEALEYLLVDKWRLEADDQDMVLMLHDITYHLNEQVRRSKSWLVCKGKDATDTAMSRLVGLPLALGVEAFLAGGKDLKGLVLPTDERLYLPVLAHLAQLGVSFEHEDVAVS